MTGTGGGGGGGADVDPEAIAFALLLLLLVGDLAFDTNGSAAADSDFFRFAATAAADNGDEPFLGINISAFGFMWDIC